MLGGCLQSGELVVIPRDAAVRMTFLHTSDIHSRLLPYTLEPTAADEKLGLLGGNGPFGGGARLATLLRRERARSQRVMHLDSGDCFQGAPIYNANNGEVEMRFMSLMQPDAVVVGNHEFDTGVRSYVNQLAKWGSFPNLAANYVFPDYQTNANNHDSVATRRLTRSTTSRACALASSAWPTSRR